MPDVAETASQSLLPRLERQLHSALQKHALIHVPRTFEPSKRPVTLVMPLAVKDLAHAQRTVETWRRLLGHPIRGVVVLGQSSPEVAAFAARISATYVDEDKVLSPEVLAFAYRTNGRNRNGWIRQQILKFSADAFVADGDMLIIDSDTRPVRPISFDRAGRPLLFTSDEYNPTYHACIDRLLGPQRWYRRSFIAHCMLFERDVLVALKGAIELQCKRPWAEAVLSAIDTRVEESFSEYETYGTFVFNRYPQCFRTAYWFNRKVRSGSLDQDFVAGAEHGRFNFVSRHVQPDKLAPDQT